MRSGTGYLTACTLILSLRQDHNTCTNRLWRPLNEIDYNVLSAWEAAHNSFKRVQGRGGRGRVLVVFGLTCEEGERGSLQGNLIGSPCSLAPGFPLLGTAPRPNHRESSFSHWSLALSGSGRWAGPGTTGLR